MARLDRVNVRRTNLANRNKPIIHERTRTSRAVREIEDQLVQALSKQVNLMRKQPYYNNISLLTRNFNVVVSDLIHSAIYHVYSEGAQYVADFTNFPASYLTENDLITINDINNDFVTQFWQRMQAYISGRNSVLTNDLNFHPRKDVSTSFVVSSFASRLATRVLSLSTLAKSRQQLTRFRNPYYKTAAAAATTTKPNTNLTRSQQAELDAACPEGEHYDENVGDCISDDLNQDFPPLLDTLGQLGTTIGAGLLGGTILGQSLQSRQDQQQLEQTTVMVWVTAFDDRVCPICQPLHGQTWELSDESMLVPPDDSHPNCRCRLMLQQGDSDAIDIVDNAGGVDLG